MTPSPSLIPKSHEKNTLQMTVEKIEAPITHFTSPLALRPLGSALWTEQSRAKAKLCTRISIKVRALVSLERAKP